MGCGRLARNPILRWIKFLLTILVINLWILSIIFLYVACWIRDNLSRIVLVTEGTLAGDFYLVNFFPVIFPILIVVSCFLLVVGCLGCCGTVTDNQILLGWFFFSMLLIICLELSAGVWRIMNLGLSYDDSDIEQLRLNGRKYGEYIQREWFVRAWKDIHAKFQCCGINSYLDWEEVPDILTTCCSSLERESCLLHLKSLKTEGCGKHLMKFLTEPIPLNSIPYLTTIIGTMQIMCLILTLTLWLTMCVRKDIAALQGQIDPLSKNMCSTNSCQIHSSISSKRKRSQLPEIPIKDLSDNEYITAKTLPIATKNCGKTHCRKCCLNAYEEIQLFPVPKDDTHSQLPYFSNIKRSTSGLNRINGKCKPTTCSLDAVVTKNSFSKLSKSSSSRGLFHPYESDMKRCASSQLPMSYKFPSNGSVSPCSRACYSAGMPRKKYCSYTPRQRRRTRRNDLRRLSPIRASGFGAASDSSLDLAVIEKTHLLDNKLYNTEESGHSCNETTVQETASKLCSSTPDAFNDTQNCSFTCKIDIDDTSDDFKTARSDSTPRNSEKSYPTL